MLSLPSDLQLEIMKFLDPRDIVHFQLTCKYFNNLIEEAGTMIWRECLQQHCLRNQLFSPGYGDLSTISEYKHAVAAPVRFARSYDRATLSPGARMTSTITNLRLDRDDLDLERDGWAAWVDRQIRDIYLIRGGRFLLVWTNTSYEIWDLRDSIPTPNLAFSQTIGHVDYLMYTNAPAANKLHFMWSREETIPPGLILSVDEVHRCERWILVEVTYEEEEGFNAKQYEHTFLYTSRIGVSADLNIVSSDSEVLFQASDMTLLWDYAHSSFTGWILGVEGGHAYTELFLMQGYLIYISPVGLSGLHLSRMAKPEPINGDYVYFRDLCSLPTSPSFSLLHDRVYAFTGHDVGSPDLCRPLDGARSMIYDIRCHQGTNPLGHQGAPPHLYRYRFALDPDKPTQSTLELSQVLKCAYPIPNDMSLSSLVNYHQRCNGRFGVAWHNHLALSKPAPLANRDSDPELRKDSLQFVPFCERRLGSASFCPASSKAVVQFKEIDDSGSLTTRLVLYNFL